MCELESTRLDRTFDRLRGQFTNIGLWFMNFPERYKAEVVSAVESIDLDEVAEVIDLFKQARSHGHSIFICANTKSSRTAARVVSDMMTRSSFGRSARFRVLALQSESAETSSGQDGGSRDGVFVEQLKIFAGPGDVVVGICASGNSTAIVRALDYGTQIGCKTVALTGSDSSKLGTLADISVHVASTQLGTVEDTQIIICHMIGSYFQDYDGQ